MKKRICSGMIRMTALALSVLLVGSLVCGSGRSALVTRTLRLEQAQRMALSCSSDIRLKQNEIILKRMKYVEAVEGIKAKVKNLTTLRWSPLLNFKFPQELAMTEEYDLNVKPLVLQTEIDILIHRMEDLEYEIINEVNLAYFDVYLLQETTAFTQARLEDAGQQLRRNQAKLVKGDATQTDVDRAQSSVDTLTSELASQMRDFENAKTKLSELIGVDVTVGYQFKNGLKMAAIPRERLEDLTQYTLDHDQAYYEAKVATSVAQINVESYESLMEQEYGSKLNYIRTYINLVKQGVDVDYAAFQLKYREMLKAVDKPWAGNIKILFFKFSKERLKGEIDGTRYIEDELYALYTACMEYANARKEQKSLEKELRSQVRDGFENIVTAWNSYQNLQELAADALETLERLRALNRIGKATYEEVADEQTAYQDAQQDALDALKDYNDLLSEFDRLTCGAVTQYLKSTGMGLETGEGGDAYAVLDPINDPYYYIYTCVADMTFYFGVSIPEDFEPSVDKFEVWCGGTQLGERMDVGTELQHLSLDYQDTGALTLRLYSGSEFVHECEIDAGVPRDVLEIPGKMEPVGDRVVGTYSVSTTMQGEVSVSELKLRINAVEGAARYNLTYGSDGIYTTDLRPVSESFSYLTLLISSLQDVTLKLYDNDGEHVADAMFDTETQELVIPAPAE